MAVSVLATCLSLQLLVIAQTGAPKLQILDQAGMQNLERSGDPSITKLDLLLLRGKPSLLDDTAFMDYFAMLNNCSTSQANITSLVHALKSELDRPAIASFYKSKASEILAVVPNTVSIGMQFFPVQQGKAESQMAFQLGDYDPVRKAFPFVDNRKRPVTVRLDHITAFPGERGSVCGTYRANFIAHTVQGPQIFTPQQSPAYMMNFDAITFSELPMDEAAARSFIANPGSRTRQVLLNLDLEILPAAPTTNADPEHWMLYVIFSAKVKEIKVVSFDNAHRTVGVLPR